MYEPDERVSTSAPSRVAPPEAPAAMWHEAALVNDDLKAATGIYDASLGAKGNETSGVAIARRQQEGDVSNYHFSDNLQLSLEHAGRVMLDLIPRIYDFERVVRLMGDDDTHSYASINETVIGYDGQPVLVNNLAQAKFDIRVDIGPSYTTQRIEAATSMLDYAKSDPTAMPVMRDIFVRNMDWPGADQLADRLKKTIPPQYLSDKEGEQAEPQMPDPATQAAAQIQMQDAQLKLAKSQAEIDQIKVETQAKVAETRLKIRDANSPARTNGATQQPVVIATQPDSVQIGMKPEEFAMLADGISRQSDGLAQGLAALGQSIEAGNLQMAQAVAVQMSHAIEMQGQQMAMAVEQLGEGGKAMIDAAQALNKPKRITLERDARGNLTGASSEVEDEAA